jgi:RNA polymerase sigma-70 factor (ECF subfamily)
MLRALAGLTAGEIGRLLHESEEAVQRRISRAKDKLTLEDLNAGDKESKHDSVSLALYLMFTEGYEASRGNEYVRLDLALCALRLAEELAKFSTDTSGKLEALLALMHFNLSRMAARVDSNGEPILLPDQDRSRYDMGHVSRGFFYLSEAQKGTDLSRYHMEAGLAAAICASADSGEVLYWHRTLATHFPTPVNRISLAIALGEYEDYSVGLSALDRLAEDDLVTRTPHFHCARGHFLAKLGRREEAGDAFRRAIAAGMSNPARRSFEARIEELG